MIRDPSDGSVKSPNVSAEASGAGRTAKHSDPTEAARFCQGRKQPPQQVEALHTCANNWGLTSLNRDPKPSTFKPMTPEQLAEHYGEYGLRFEKKEREE